MPAFTNSRRSRRSRRSISIGSSISMCWACSSPPRKPSSISTPPAAASSTSVRSSAPGAGRRIRLQRHQGRRGHRHQGACQGTGPAQDPRQFPQSRHGGNRRRAHCRLHRQRFPEEIEAQTPLGRIGQPNDIGKVAAFLASEDSGWITGETLLVSGGQP